MTPDQTHALYIFAGIVAFAFLFRRREAIAHAVRGTLIAFACAVAAFFEFENRKDTMKSIARLAVLFAVCTLAGFGQNTKRIFLSAKSNITTAEVAEGFSKYCPNVVLTQNEAKADYVLEAAETVSADEGTTYKHWHFTLMNADGDVLMTTHPEAHFAHKFKHHFEAVCKFVNK